MVILVVVFNTLLSLLLLYVAWRVRKIQQVLAFVANKFISYERATHEALDQKPELIYASQQQIHKLRQGNQKLEVQIHQIQQVINLLLLGRQALNYARKKIP